MFPQHDAVDLPPDAIEVARVAEPWGVKGWFKLHAYSADPQALFSSKRWFLLPPQSVHKADSAPVPASVLRISEAREHGAHIVALAHGFDDRDKALGLRGSRVFIPRSGFPSTAPDEYYWVDLIGLDVVNRDGQALGRVSELLATAAQTVLVCQLDLGGKSIEHMIPFVAKYVDSVDLEGRRIQVDWQADY